jgi:hypothetical protein
VAAEDIDAWGATSIDHVGFADLVAKADRAVTF